MPPTNSKLSLYIESIITDKYENFYSPPDPDGIGGFFSFLKTFLKKFYFSLKNRVSFWGANSK